MKHLDEIKARWIWDIGLYSNNTISLQHELVYFRRTFHAVFGYTLNVRISADSRYRLFINGTSVSVGPCKGDTWNTHYETVDLTPYLKDGKNVLAAVVLHLPNIQPFVFGVGGSVSTARSSQGGFLLQGELMDGVRIVEQLHTCHNWKCHRTNAVEFIPGTLSIPATSYEHIYGERIELGWNTLDYEDTDWAHAYEIEVALFPPEDSQLYGIISSWQLVERSIPATYEVERDFVNVTKGSMTNQYLKGLVIPKETACSIELDAGELMTAYIHMATSGGAGSVIKVTYSECYEEYMGEKPVDWISMDEESTRKTTMDKVPADKTLVVEKIKDREYKKGVRDNADGVLRGDYDLFEPAKGEIVFEPFWYRTFRYIRLDIETAQEELFIKSCGYRETGYPLVIIGHFQSSDEYSKKLWEISVRTLKRCMFETFIDCPYYEQLQYIMDTRLQALYSYQISADNRLARKAIDDFRRSLTPDGLLQSRYPSMQMQIIPAYSLHWIYMLKEYWMYYGDLELIKRCRPVMDCILDWYDRKITDTGLVGRTGYWSFIDWVQGWDMDSIPTANRAGPMTMDTLMYIKALQDAALLNNASGRDGIAKEYLDRAYLASEAVRKYCWDEEKGLFTDGPGVMEYCQHTQVWSVLSGVMRGTLARKVMKKAIDDHMPKMSYAATYFLCRALEITGLYNEYYGQLWKPWKEMINLKLTTWVEDPVTQRSDCHGWGALPLYEFASMILGVKPASTGYEAILIQPYTCNLYFAKGTVATIHGPVDVSWNIRKSTFTIKITGPTEIPVKLCLPDGSVREVQGGRFEAMCMIP